jgi:uncharacterized membrane protein
MTSLIAGLLIVIATHSLKMCAPAWRSGMIDRFGPWWWRIGHSVVSLLGVLLLVAGYGEARAQENFLYLPPPFTRHLAVAMMLPSLVLIFADLLPRNHLRVYVRHPALLGTMVWSIAHLLANGRLAEWILFGGFLLWAMAAYWHARRQDHGGEMVVRESGKWLRTFAVVVLALAVWAGFIGGLHQHLIGVPPMVFSASGS